MLNKAILKAILIVLVYFACRQRISRVRWKCAPSRCVFIFQNKNDEHLFSRTVKVPSGMSIEVIPSSGVPFEYFVQSNIHTYPASKPKWDTSSCQEIIYCARLLNSKGINTFIELASVMQDKKFIVYGDRDYSCNDSISNDKLNFYKNAFPNVEFKGNVENPLLQCLENPSILIVPSLYGEGFPRSILEAMALKIPVIATEQSCCGILTSDEIYIVKANRIHNYIEMISEVLDDCYTGAIFKKLDHSHSLSRDFFSESNIVELTLSVYRKLLARHEHNYILSKLKSSADLWLAP